MMLSIYCRGHSIEQVITLSITGALNAVLSKEHCREMCRYLYNHQASIVSGNLGFTVSYLCNACFTSLRCLGMGFPTVCKTFYFSSFNSKMSVCRTVMVDGVYILRVQAPCLGLRWIMLHWGCLVKGLMMDKGRWRKGVNGFWTMAVPLQ